jgi:hypothetical protein
MNTPPLLCYNDYQEIALKIGRCAVELQILQKWAMHECELWTLNVNLEP